MGRIASVVEYKVKCATKNQIKEHLLECDDQFDPRLSERVELGNFSNKIFVDAITFEAWHDNSLVGFVSAYMNDEKKHSAYINHVSVLNRFAGQGIASRLITNCISHAESSGLREIWLEVSKSNLPAIDLYTKLGFEVIRDDDSAYMMLKRL